MYRSFKIDGLDTTKFSSYVKYAKINLESKKKDIETDLSKHINKQGYLDCSEISKEWFPTIKNDIFISHSHKDEELALGLAGWLMKEFRLNVFIDSYVWGYCNDLLKLLDKEHCYKPETDTFSYEMRNNTTAHVHNILGVALTKMIDKSECLIFLNTENSILDNNYIESTGSPWIYLELSFRQMVRIKNPSRKVVILKEAEIKNFTEERSLLTSYRVDTSDLEKLSLDDLTKWEQAFDNKNHPLDYIYSIKDEELKKWSKEIAIAESMR